MRLIVRRISPASTPWTALAMLSGSSRLPTARSIPSGRPAARAGSRTRLSPDLKLRRGQTGRAAWAALSWRWLPGLVRRQAADLDELPAERLGLG